MHSILTKSTSRTANERIFENIVFVFKSTVLANFGLYPRQTNLWVDSDRKSIYKHFSYKRDLQYKGTSFLNTGSILNVYACANSVSEIHGFEKNYQKSTFYRYLRIDLSMHFELSSSKMHSNLTRKKQMKRFLKIQFLFSSQQF